MYSYSEALKKKALLQNSQVSNHCNQV